jgi:RNA polymerase sigma factor (sigma-70 family)
MLARGLRELDEDKRLLLAMRITGKMTYREMAIQLGLSESTVRGRLFRAREKLRAIVQRNMK